MRPDFWDVSVSELQVIPDPVVTLVPPDMDRINDIISNKLEHKVGLTSFRCFPWIFVIYRSE